MKTYTLVAGQFAEFILTRESSETQNDDVNCGNTSLIEDMNDIFNYPCISTVHIIILCFTVRIVKRAPLEHQILL